MAMSPVISLLNNPEDLEAIQDGPEAYYPGKVTENFRFAILVLTGIYLALGITALCIMTERKEKYTNSTTSNRNI